MDAWLTRMYERHGRRYVSGAIAALLLPGVLLIPALLILPARYQELSVGEYGIAVLIGLGSLVVSAGLALWALGGRLRPLFAWSAGERGQELAATAGAWAFKVPRQAVLLTTSLAAVIAVPTVVLALVLPSAYTEAEDYAGIAIGVLGTVVVLTVYGYAGLETALRPVRASLRRYEVPASPSPGLAAALASPLVIIFLVGGGAGYLITDRSAGDTGLLVVWAVSLTITAVSAIPFLLVAFGVVLAPLRDLIQGHREVGHGALPQIPVSATDELGELTASFNEMVDGLREREELRVRNAELVDELQASRARIVASSDEARRKVERDLHDGAQQNLVLLNLKLSLAERAAESAPEARALVAEARTDLDRALDELRDLAHGIYPAVLTSDGLPGALAEATDASPIPTSFECDGATRYPPELEAAVYFCCLEALQNAAKHAGAEAKANVTLKQLDRELHFEVADDGVGFEVASVNGSAGLQNMADRIGALGGELTVRSTPGSGTTIAGAVPVKARSPE